jgi:hypothetical protein
VGAVRFLMPDLRSEAYPFHPESSEKQGLRPLDRFTNVLQGK